MSAAPPIDVGQEIDEAPLRGLQILAFGLCFLVAMLDGFDTQAIAFVAPAIAEAWNIPGNAFGPVFSAALVGLMVGQVLFGLVSDRFGRRLVIIASTLMFGVLTLCTGFAKDWNALLALRFLAGIGLGGAIPNVMAMTSEFAPRRHQATLIALVFAGFPLGAVVGGYLSILMLPTHGWPSVFFLGGIAPVVLTLLLLILLPESPRFLVQRPNRQAALIATMRRITGRDLDAGTRFTAEEAKVERLPLIELFRGGRAARTLTLWPIFFLSLLVIYFLLSWLPLLLKQRGLTIEGAISASVALNLGGAVGGVILGRFVDRYNPVTVLGGAYGVGAACIFAIGMVADQPWLLTLAVIGAGFCSVGAQTALCAFTASLYPTSVRSTGLGSALAVGRIGSVIGPVAGGALLASGLAVQGIFAAVASPALVSTVLFLALRSQRAPEVSA